MIVADLTADHIGQTISFPTWSALGYCRRGELTFIAPHRAGHDNTGHRRPQPHMPR
jgi:hypothetical protein